MQTVQAELSDRKQESEEKRLENTAKDFKITYAKKMQDSNLQWEDIAGLF